MRGNKYFSLIAALFRPANSTRIRESILATILVTFCYENQFPPLNCIQTDSVSIEFDSCKLKRICSPALTNILASIVVLALSIASHDFDILLNDNI